MRIIRGSFYKEPEPGPTMQVLISQSTEDLSFGRVGVVLVMVV